MNIGLDGDKIVTEIIEKLLIELGKAAVPYMKRAVVAVLAATCRVFSRPLQWLRRQAEHLTSGLTYAPATTPFKKTVITL